MDSNSTHPIRKRKRSEAWHTARIPGPSEDSPGSRQHPEKPQGLETEDLHTEGGSLEGGQHQGTPERGLSAGAQGRGEYQRRSGSWQSQLAEAVENALEREGWNLTEAPYSGGNQEGAAPGHSAGIPDAPTAAPLLPEAGLGGGLEAYQESEPGLKG